MLLKKHLDEKAADSGGSNTSSGTHNYGLRKQVSMALLLQRAPISCSDGKANFHLKESYLGSRSAQFSPLQTVILNELEPTMDIEPGEH